MSKKIILSFILFLGIWFGAIGQDTQTEIIDYSKPAEYIIGGITVT